MDRDAIRNILAAHEDDPAGIILRLAWEEGLKRGEILALKWNQVDFERRRITLPDRRVPLQPGAAEALLRWRDAQGEAARDDAHVVLSLRTKKPLSGASVSAAAREALDTGGMQGVRLEDLRADYIRRAAEAGGEGFALRVSGIGASTRRRLFGEDDTVPDSYYITDYITEEERALLWQTMQRNRAGSAGVALWLSQQANLKGAEIATLTWEQVDLEKGVLRLGGRDVMLIQEVIAVLREEKARRAGIDDPHVVLLPTTQRPLTPGQLSTMLHELLRKNGLGNLRLGRLRSAEQAERDFDSIRRYVRRTGSITRREAVTMLGLSAGTAGVRLRQMVESGELAQTSKGCIPAEQAVPRERWEDAVRRRAEERGFVTIPEVETLLHVGKKTARELLRSMTDGGLLVANGNHKRYMPPSNQTKWRMFYQNGK